MNIVSSLLKKMAVTLGFAPEAMQVQANGQALTDEQIAKLDGSLAAEFQIDKMTELAKVAAADAVAAQKTVFQAELQKVIDTQKSLSNDAAAKIEELQVKVIALSKEANKGKGVQTTVADDKQGDSSLPIEQQTRLASAVAIEKAKGSNRGKTYALMLDGGTMSEKEYTQVIARLALEFEGK